jgi:hypothetical protein
LVDQIFFDTTVPTQQIRHEQFREFLLSMQNSMHRRLGDARNEAFINRCGCCDTQRMTIETAFAIEKRCPNVWQVAKKGPRGRGWGEKGSGDRYFGRTCCEDSQAD